MKRSRVIWSIALCAFVLLLGGGAAFVHRLLYTQEGLDLLVRQLTHLQTVRIEVTGTHGVLAGPLSADKVVVDHETVHIEARQLGLHPGWHGALAGLVTVDGVSIGSIDVTLSGLTITGGNPAGSAGGVGFSVPAMGASSSVT